ncbi:MAG: Asp-tRNA(Asn)/Glu-tRNA(Gln) amidotransferase GatCAB subunit B, partial [Omnitrophica bacterium]|nr:Asp-tRNA(Asn)/Glu-tRNA(Gln) amidotransferase GatCAB subunit B [Candidatus Omnitrophota bacterium]
MLDGKREASDIVKEKGIEQISDTSELEEAVAEVIQEFSKPVSDYYEGKINAFTFLIGQTMRKTRGRANPKMINKILKQKLGRREDA